MFEEMFDFWLAKHFLDMNNKGFDAEQMVIEGKCLLMDFSEAIDDEQLLQMIWEKISVTIKLLGENKNEQTV